MPLLQNLTKSLKFLCQNIIIFIEKSMNLNILSILLISENNYTSLVRKIGSLLQCLSKKDIMKLHTKGHSFVNSNFSWQQNIGMCLKSN